MSEINTMEMNSSPKSMRLTPTNGIELQERTTMLPNVPSNIVEDQVEESNGDEDRIEIIAHASSGSNAQNYSSGTQYEVEAPVSEGD